MNKMKLCFSSLFNFLILNTLVGHIPDDEEQFLSWEERIQIALDISHGIEYLHEGVG
jgi:hypothetical protein